MHQSEEDPFGDSSAAEDELATATATLGNTQEEKGRLEAKTELKSGCSPSIDQSAQFLANPSGQPFTALVPGQQPQFAAIYGQQQQHPEKAEPMAPPQALAAWMVAYGGGGAAMGGYGRGEGRCR